MWKLLCCVRLLVTPRTPCLWNSPDQNTGVGSLSLLHRPNGSPALLVFFTSWPTRRKSNSKYNHLKNLNQFERSWFDLYLFAFIERWSIFWNYLSICPSSGMIYSCPKCTHGILTLLLFDSKDIKPFIIIRMPSIFPCL